MKLPKRPIDATTVGLDPSLTSYGVAVYRPGAPNATAVLKTDMVGPARLVALRDQLHVVLNEVDDIVSIIAVEGYSFMSKYSRAHDLGEIGGVTRVLLYEMFTSKPSVQIIVVPPENLKKFCGVKKKEEMRLAVYKLWNFEAKSNDEVDAYALARYAAVYVGIDEPQFQYQREALVALRKDSTHLLLC